MTFKEAAAFRIPYGKYAGLTVDQAAQTDEGLMYLDWWRGVLEKKDTHSDILPALCAYLDDETIVKELQKLIA
jgi:hypothetical protein